VILYEQAKMEINLNKITRNRKCIFLAYDQGLEHGPTDFNDKNVDPKYVLDIAAKGRYNAVILQKGIAEKYYKPYKKKVPLILKLNGKTRLLKGDPVSTQVCSVKKAIELGASAVGYTIYIGSEHEPEMFSQFKKIEEEAHANGLPVVMWAYPRGAVVKNELGRDILAYAARIGLELGADIIKLKYNGRINDLKWIIKSAGKAKVVIAGGSKVSEKELLKETREVIRAGASGLAIGRNIWQSDNPLERTKKLKEIIWEK